MGLCQQIKPGMSVAIAVGSRGIDRIALTVRTLVEQIKALGAEPFVFPAMGSHGGATAAGQARVLETLGVTESLVGCPVRATMEVVTLGRTPGGLPVYLDRFAAGADAIVVVNRVKPHTNFRGPVESGLMKMIAIGAGKHVQASTIHRLGVQGLRDQMPEVARRGPGKGTGRGEVRPAGGRPPCPDADRRHPGRRNRGRGNQSARGGTGVGSRGFL